MNNASYLMEKYEALLMNSNEQRIIDQYRISNTKNTTISIYLRDFHYKIES